MPSGVERMLLSCQFGSIDCLIMIRVLGSRSCRTACAASWHLLQCMSSADTLVHVLLVP